MPSRRVAVNPYLEAAFSPCKYTSPCELPMLYCSRTAVVAWTQYMSIATIANYWYHERAEKQAT